MAARFYRAPESVSIA